MTYQGRAFHGCFIPCQRIYGDQHNQWNIRAMHDGKVECVTVKYNTTFLYSVWLYCLCHGINRFSHVLRVKAELYYNLILDTDSAPLSELSGSAPRRQLRYLEV